MPTNKQGWGFEDLFEGRELPKQGRKPDGNPNRRTIPELEDRDLFEKELQTKTQNQIAKELKCSPYLVHRAKIKHGIYIKHTRGGIKEY